MYKLSVLNPYFPLLSDNFEEFLNSTSDHMSDYKMNIKDVDDVYQIELAVPGFKEDSFSISIENGVLTVSAHIEKEIEDKKDLIKREFITRSFSRSFAFPTMVDQNHAEAFYDNGILKIEVKKSEAARPKKIEIKKREVQN